MNKKGFTLVEIMAVVAILGILVIMVAPRVINYYRDSKKLAFINEAKVVYSKATDKYVLEKTKGNKISYITNKKGEEENPISLQNEKDLEYEVRLGDKGIVTGFRMTNSNFCILGAGNFLDDYTIDKIIDLSYDDNNCILDSFNEDESLYLTLVNEKGANLITKQSPSRVIIKYDNGMFRDDGSELGKNDLDSNYKIDDTPVMKNYYYKGFYAEEDKDMEIISCDGSILLDNHGLPLFTDLKVNNKRVISVFEKKYYEITFKDSDNQVSNVKCYYESECSIPNTVPVKTGYNHLGWTKTEGGNTVDFNVGTTLPIITDDNENINDGLFKFDVNEYCKGEPGNYEPRNYNNTINLYPVWELIKYQVSYDCNGGTGNMQNTTHTYNESSKLRMNTCVRDNYNFVGWATTSSATVQEYVDEAIVKNLSSTEGSVVKLYAVWVEKVPDVFVITLSNEGAITDGTGNIYEKFEDGYYLDASTTKKMTGSANKITIPTKTNYEFKGYFTEKSGSGTRIIKEDGFIDTSLSNTEFNSNKTIYANWEENIPVYTITLSNEGASSAGSSKIYEKYNVGFYLDAAATNNMSNSANKITVPSKSNNKFKGYFTQKDGKGTKVINEDGTIVASLSKTTFSANTTIYANWEITANFAFKYTKKFKVKDGTKAEATYAGGETVYLNGDDWYVKFLESGTLTVYNIKQRADIFLISGGGNGADGAGGWPACAGGTGGQGGIWLQSFYINVAKTSYSITVGGAAAHSKFVSKDKNVSSIELLTNNSTITRKKGGSPAKVNWDCKPVDAKPGEDGVFPFSDSTFNYRYGAGGGGGAENSPNGNGARGAGGANSGAKGCRFDSANCDAGANTGGGGGGGFGASDYKNYAANGKGGKGGSGIVIMRRSQRITVTFNANGGKITKNEKQNFYHGKTGQKFADTGATKSGKTLAGWALTPNATKENYGVNSGVSDNWILKNRPSITLYAVWK